MVTHSQFFEKIYLVFSTTLLWIGFDYGWCNLYYVSVRSIYQNISVWAPQNPTPFYQVSTIIDLEQFEIKDQGYVQTIQDSFLWRHEKLLICYSMNTYPICDSPL